MYKKYKRKGKKIGEKERKGEGRRKYSFGKECAG